MMNQPGDDDDNWGDVAVGALVSATWAAVSVLFIGGLLLLAMTTKGESREQYPGQYSQVDPEKREWYRRQISPSGYGCCSEADGADVEEDVRKGQYWVRWDKSAAMHPETNGWIKVPEDVIIPGPNKYGPVVWWAYSEETGLSIRCYVRGPQF